MHKAQPQTYSVLSNDAPTLGATFKPENLVISLGDTAPAGSTVSPDGKTITLPGEGTYVVNTNGTITFTPEPILTGQAMGISYEITDTAGLTIRSTYKPFVDPTTTPSTPPVVSACSVIESTALRPFGEQIRIYPAVNGSTGSVALIPNTTDLIQSWSDIASSADGSRLVATKASSDTISLSTNGGSTWTTRALPLSDPPVLGARSVKNIAMSTDGMHVVALRDFVAYASNDGGESWSILKTNESTDPWSAGAMNSDGSKIAMTSGSIIYITSDGGVNWTTYSLASNIEEITMSTDSAKLTAVTGVSGHAYTSVDGGVTWTDNVTYDQVTGIWDDITASADGTKLAVAAESGYVYTSTDSGATWTPQLNPRPQFDANLIDIDPTTTGLQRTIDKTATEGWNGVYDPATDLFTITVTNAARFNAKPDMLTSYTLYVDGCTQPVPSRILITNRDISS